ncbi:MAG: DUF5696 domain-containing protein [Planctomycetota bacterium]
MEPIDVKVDDLGRITVTQPATGAVWRPDPWENSPGHLTLKGKDGRLFSCDLAQCRQVAVERRDARWFVSFSGFHSPAGEIDGTLQVRVEADGDSLLVAVESLALQRGDVAFVRLAYPLRSFYLETGTPEGYLVLTHKEGCLLPTDDARLDTVDFWMLEDSVRSLAGEGILYGWTMPFFGARHGKGGYTAVIETPFDAEMACVYNYDGIMRFVGKGERSPYPRIAACWPVWLATKGKFGYERRVRYAFASRLDYVGMAKHYRRFAAAEGIVKTLTEKAASRPNVNLLAGAPYLAYYVGYPHIEPQQPGYEYRYSDLKRTIDDLSTDLRLKRASIHFWGGLAKRPPGGWPVDESAGTRDDLKAAIDAAHRAGFLFTFYTDVSALLEETPLWNPDWMVKNEDGSLRGYRWSRNCSTLYKRFAADFLPHLVKEMGVKACYIDCIGAHLRECYSESHPTTRDEDRRRREDLWRYVHNLGLVYGGEHIVWWSVPWHDYANDVGAAEGGHHILDRHRIPLFHLVFGDCLICFPWAGADYASNRGPGIYGMLLRDMLVGIPPMFFMNLRDAARWRERIRLSYDTLCPVAEATFSSELLSHERLTADGLVQRTRFENGVEVVVNFSDEGFTGEGAALPGRGFKATGLPKAHEGRFVIDCKLKTAE